MLPFNKIICPTDFSDPASKALSAAEELALHFKAELVLIHVVSPIQIPAGAQLGRILQEIQAASQQKINEIAKEKVSDAVKTRTMLALGSAADEITKLAEEERADVIVIATHGWTGWRRFVFGSVAEKVVRSATCPVLTICRMEEGVEHV
jgi:nucleotide-binding universal stress UspA family protein